jgi:hypothetical protein
LVPLFGKRVNGRLGINSYWMEETEDALKHESQLQGHVPPTRSDALIHPGKFLVK